MPTVPFLGSYGDISGRSLMFRNVLLNGGFDIWQRATSQTTSGYGSDDRWSNDNAGSTKTHSRQTFALGQTDVPGNPKYFTRTVVTSVAGSGNYTAKYQKIEGVSTLSGQTVTLSFWAKADSAKNIATSTEQFFGSGGSPSSGVTGIGITTHALTTSWRYFTSTFTLPSVSGKVLGTNNDDCLSLLFWFDAGSTFNARTNSLGQQSGTFDIANVQLEAGPVATPFEYRPIGTELALCQRYYQLVTPTVARSISSTDVQAMISHGMMRITPTTVLWNGGTLSVSDDATYDKSATPTIVSASYSPTVTRVRLSGWSGLTVNIYHSISTSTGAVGVPAEL